MKCEHCGKEFDVTTDVLWVLCNKCRLAAENLKTTAEMLEYENQTSEVLSKFLEEKNAEYCSLIKAYVATGEIYKNIKNKFKTEANAWDLWTKEYLELYLMTHQGTMHQVLSLACKNDFLRQRIAFVQHMISDLKESN
jgi:hypothetical protein